MTLDLPYPWLEDEALQANFDRIRTEWPEPASPWKPYTATVTTVTLGTGGTNVARYAKHGRTVHCHGCITLGTGGSLTGSPVEVALPLAAAAYPQVGVVTANNVGTQLFPGVARIAASASTFKASFEGGAFLSATGPFTWGDTDVLTWQITYETAV